MAQRDAWFFIGIFAFMFLVWFAIGGPTRPVAITLPALPKLTASSTSGLGGGTYFSLPRTPYGIGNSYISLIGSSNGGGSLSGGTGISLPPIIGGGTLGPSSPYQGIVSMSHYVSGAGSQDPGNEHVQITVAQNARTPVDISGWTLESGATGAASVIPKGTEVPLSGVINATQDIVLTPGQRALIISGQSPIGASFRENKCIGYFSDFQRFSPSLPQNCPAPSSELVSFYGPNYIRDAACIEYVNGLPRCQVELSPPVTVSGACQSFLVKYLNYNGCVAAHEHDADFMGATWRVYLGRTNSMWRTRYEVVKLLDAQGKIVDAFSY